ncbi:hypothetical protein MNBD_GAMMA18-1919 [hydrothermal vent metagenome]|uniref:RRM domain-containing protein n=1 Tax=hydrothermal vent metagenome TaxID=652676 RepID=A0A3B0YTG4_9ZZZZ
MEIFIGNIPENLTSYELRRFVDGIFESRSTGLQFWKKKSPKQLSFKIVNKHVEGRLYHYAIANIGPSEMGPECIELLNQQLFNNVPLEVREYYSRSYMNERRTTNWREQPWSDVERRCTTDRRQRDLLSHEDVAPAAPAPVAPVVMG